MGMDYKFAGSSPYSFFAKQLSELALNLGAKLSNEYDVRKIYINNLADSNDDYDQMRHLFIWSDKTPLIIKKFFDNPYGFYSVEETKEIKEWIFGHKRISDEYKYYFKGPKKYSYLKYKCEYYKILNELYLCDKNNTDWNIN